MDEFSEWLFGEAGAGWVLGVLGLLGSTYVWIRRDRAPKVIVQEVSRLKLLNIHPSQRDNLRVLYVDERNAQTPIQSLEQQEFVVYNNGGKDILEPLHLEVLFYKANSESKEICDFWRLLFEDDKVVWETKRDAPTGMDCGVRITLPYLNSFGNHRQYLRAHLISNEEVSVKISEGIGKGWSARFVPLARTRRLAEILEPILQLGSVGLLLGGIYVGIPRILIGFGVLLLLFMGVASSLVARKIAYQWVGVTRLLQ